jgi:hypothetical protein
MINILSFLSQYVLVCIMTVSSMGPLRAWPNAHGTVALKKSQPDMHKGKKNVHAGLG